MDAIRSLLSLILAFALATFALPSMGDSSNKNFTLTMALGSVDSSQSGNTTVTATIYNDNINDTTGTLSNSQIGSFTIFIATNSSGLTIVGASPTEQSAATFGGTATLGPNNSVNVTGITPLKPGDSYTVTISLTGCGDGNQWGAQVWSGTNLGGTPYNDNSAPQSEATNVPCGAVACGNTLGGLTVSSLISITGKSSIVSSRGANQDDGTCPTSTVNYFITRLLDRDTNVKDQHFRWDTEPSAVFFYIANQPLGPQPLFAWKTDGLGNPLYVAAQACDQGSKATFPVVYGTVTAIQGVTLTVNTSNGAVKPPATPFRIAVGPTEPELEFMTVTKVSQGTWTVVRNATKTHSLPAPAVSTPAPALPNQPITCYLNDGTSLGACPAGTYDAGGPALMCYVPVSSDKTHTYIFDVGDGWYPTR